MPLRALTPLLRAARARVASITGALVSSAPASEPAFIAIGRAAGRRSRLLSTVYWFAEDELLRRLAGTPRRFRPLDVGGVPMQVDITTGMGRLHYFHGEPYEPELAAAIAGTLTRGDVFLDIGANIGFFTALAGVIVGDTGRVIAFEPHPDAASRLRETLAQNALGPSIDIVQAVAGDVDGSTRLFFPADSVLSTTDPARSPLAGHYTFDRWADVPSVTVDRWFAEHADLLPRLRAVKIDVEGTETEVLAGMERTLAACPCAVLFCETTAGSAADTWLRSRGYTASYLDARREAFGNYRYVRGGIANGAV
jgi:FkbM family methyltransferase